MSQPTDEKTQQQVAVNVPLFLKKLWKMVNDKDAEDIIGWNSTGDGFIIHDPIQFITKLLPHYFKHNNLASFVRQLNFYDFHKVASIDRDEMQFAHHYFLKDLPETLVFITRKCPNVKSKLSKELKEEDVHNLLHGVKELKGKHTLVDKELKLLKQENGALWNEINCLRIKYAKQTKIINKLIHFLVSYIHSHQTQSVGRKNIGKNLKAPPSLLEIAYKDPKNKLKGETSSHIIRQPETSKPLVYSVDCSDDSFDSQEQLCSNVLENIISSQNKDVNLPYSVQFPKSPRRRASQENVTMYKEGIGTSNSKELNKLAQLNDSNALEEIFQTSDPDISKEVNYSIGHQKIHNADKTVIKNIADEESTQSASTSSRTPRHSKRLPESDILDNIFLLPESESSPTPTKQCKLETTDTSSNSSNNATLSVEPIIDDQFIFDQLPNTEVPLNGLNEILLDPSIVVNIQTVPAQPRSHLKFDIRENPEQKFAQYVDSTQSEINTLQDVLTNLNPKDLATIFQELSPMPNDPEFIDICDAMIDEGKDEADNNNLKEIKRELVNELAHLPGGSGDDSGNMESENIVDEYFNDDLVLKFTNDECHLS